MKSLPSLAGGVICYTHPSLITCCRQKHISILPPAKSHKHVVARQMG